MNSVEDFTVEVRRDGIFLSAVGRFPTVFDATSAALDSAERLARGAPGVHLEIVIASGIETLLEIKVVTGRRLDA